MQIYSLTLLQRQRVGKTSRRNWSVLNSISVIIILRRRRSLRLFCSTRTSRRLPRSITSTRPVTDSPGPLFLFLHSRCTLCNPGQLHSASRVPAEDLLLPQHKKYSYSDQVAFGILFLFFFRCIERIETKRGRRRRIKGGGWGIRTTTTRTSSSAPEGPGEEFWKIGTKFPHFPILCPPGQRFRCIALLSCLVSLHSHIPHTCTIMLPVIHNSSLLGTFP